MKNIVLVGMPSAGKSTIGIILAKVLGYQFLDSDLLIQEQEKELLKDIIDKRGIDGFLAIENQINSEIDTDHTVIATGGSVIYGTEAMKHLGDNGIIVYIKLTLQTISDRLGNMKQRGVVLRKNQTLKMLYEERCPLYEKYAHITVDGENLNTEELMESIKEALLKYEKSSAE